MSFMAWGADLHTGIDIVDTQHKWLVEATNRLHEEISRPVVNRVRAGEILAGLVAYTVKHFTMEESLFRQAGYPESDAHELQHKIFTDNINGLLSRHLLGEVVSLEALELLKRWLVEHIMKTDMGYVPLVKAMELPRPFLTPDQDAASAAAA